jgi:hypothetical protein
MSDYLERKRAEQDELDAAAARRAREDQEEAWKWERAKWYAESADPVAEFARAFAELSGEPFLWANDLTEDELREAWDE